jgi:histidine triad (HIT) family protein
MQDSIFTKIIKGEIPCHKIYEDDAVLAFLDIHPITSGHMLVVPKKQIEFLWDLDDETYQHVMAVVKKLSIHARTTLNVPFVGLQVIGVDVPHAHVHVIPFSDISDYHNIPDMSAEPNHGALAAVARKLALS